MFAQLCSHSILTGLKAQSPLTPGSKGTPASDLTVLLADPVRSHDLVTRALASATKTRAPRPRGPPAAAPWPPRHSSCHHGHRAAALTTFYVGTHMAGTPSPAGLLRALAPHHTAWRHCASTANQEGHPALPVGASYKHRCCRRPSTGFW